MRGWAAVVVLAAGLPVSACSAAMCLGEGPEFRETFRAVVRFEGRPLAGAQVKVSRADALVAEAVTGSDGAARFSRLAPGSYWLEARHHGIIAAYHCFHVAARASWRAKGQVRYEWGDYPVWTRGIEGVLVDSQAPTEGTPLERQLKRVLIPIRGARVVLINPVRGEVQRVLSDANGAFAMPGVPAGKYVLHVEGGESNRPFDSVEQMIAVGPAGGWAGLYVERRDAGGTECGDTVVRVSVR